MPKFKVTCTDDVLASDDDFVRLELPGGRKKPFNKQDGKWSSAELELTESVAAEVEASGYVVEPSPLKARSAAAKKLQGERQGDSKEPEQQADKAGKGVD